MGSMPVIDWLTTRQVGDELGIDASHVRRLCIDGKVPGSDKFGSQWMIPRASLPLIPRSPTKGRPQKGKDEGKETEK